MNFSKQLTFLYELLMSAEERALLLNLQQTPDDAATRAAYADWLEENRRYQSAGIIRGGFTPADVMSLKELEEQGSTRADAVAMGDQAGPVIREVW